VGAQQAYKPIALGKRQKKTLLKLETLQKAGPTKKMTLRLRARLLFPTNKARLAVS
jgi:hypothetical protein